MRRGIYALIGISIGAILYILMYTNTPEVQELGVVHYEQPSYDQQDLRDVPGGVTTFLKNGSYHVNTIEYENYQKNGTVRYGKDNPMFHYVHASAPPKSEEPEISEDTIVVPPLDNTSLNDLSISEKDDLGVGSREPVDLENGEMTMGFNTDSLEFEEVNIAPQLHDFVSNGTIPVDLEYYNSTSGFGVRTDPFTNLEAFHSGLDLADENVLGSNVYAISHGEVLEVIESGSGYGNHVIVQHNGYKSLYAHLHTFSDIKVGDYIPAGEVVGTVGNTGRSTGPHLHLEVIIGESTTVDPVLFLNRIGEVE